MKAVFVHSPLRSTCSPSSSIPNISGFLKSKGYQTYIYDANINFHNWILTEEKIQATFSLCSDIVNGILEYKHPKEEQIKKHFDENVYRKILGKIEKAKTILKTQDFYDPIKYKIAHFTINKALELLSLPYDTWILHERSIIGNSTGFALSDYKNAVTKAECNIFAEYMDCLSGSILEQGAESIFVLADVEGQIIPALTLASFLKKKGQKNIVIFGNYVPLIQNDLKSDISVFKDYADFFMYENNELAFLELLEYFQNKREIENVSNILHLQNEKIIENRYSSEKTKDLYFQDFEYTLDSSYLFPEKVFPINITDGCYWNKCKFCDLFSSKYTIKDINHIVREIKFCREKYNVKYFYLTDLSFSPSVAKKFAEILIKEKVNIRYSTFCRFDNEFDYKLLKLLHKSGLRCLNWGLESGSQKILDYMQKGINLSVVSRILKDCYKLGIGNKVSVIYHLPGETYEDFCDSVDFIKKNAKYIFYVGIHEFYLKRYSYIFNHLDEFGIKLNTREVKWEYKPEEFSPKFEEGKFLEKLKEIRRINSITMGGYDEINLYMSKTPLYSKSWYVNLFENFKQAKIREFFE